jgi:hypothetical protein
MRVQSSAALIAIARGFRLAALLASRPPGKKKKRENQKPIQQLAHTLAPNPPRARFFFFDLTA